MCQIDSAAIPAAEGAGPLPQVGAKIRFPSELGMLIGLVGNSFAVALLGKSDIGLTTTSLLSFVLSRCFPNLSFGTWSYLIQCGIMVGLALVIRRIKVGYALSFVLAVIFGLLVDLFTALLAPLPPALPLRALYYAVGTAMLITGIAFFTRCRLPILPVDTFTRDLCAHFGLRLKVVRTVLDVTCFVLSVALGLLLVGGLPGIGVGTVISTLITGTLSGRIAEGLDRRFAFAPLIPALERLIEE